MQALFHAHAGRMKNRGNLRLDSKTSEALYNFKEEYLYLRHAQN
jgi:hypothetical protein